MAEMLLSDHLEELWMLIDQQHLLYLISDESPGKIEQRDKLENYIREYLYVAPHNRKFTFSQTAQVLHRSASNKKNFSGFKAASAWKAIGKYADNLVMQPWRKEFKDLKLYCGFYKHEIEENLSDAELMFEAMGYCHAGNSTMTITDILDPDRITSVSKDAIVAFVECQILKEIWENLTPYYNFTWLEILEFRENHTGTPDQATKSLRYKRRQRQYEEQMYRRAQFQAAESHARPDYVYSSNMGYFNHMHYGHSHSYPFQSRYASVNAPHIVSPSSTYPAQPHSVYGAQQIIKPQDLYPPNGYHIHSHYQHPPLQESYPNHSNYHPVHSQQSSVPTAQLIELDSTPIQNNQRTNRYSEEDIACQWKELEKSESSFPSGKAKEDGAGSWENWDYIYRNLDTQGYKKNIGARGDVTSSKGNSSTRNNAPDPEGKVQGELVEKFRKVNLNSNASEANKKNGYETEEEQNSKVLRNVGWDQVPERKASPDVPKHVNSASTERIGYKKENDSENESSKDRNAKSGFKLLEKDDDSGEKWECITCTYLNSIEKQICEMCCKSKEPGGECKPQPTGGQECRNCTLVNEKGRNFCVACGKPLKDSPTYI